MKNEFNVQAVIFDMDGVVTRSMGFHVRAFQLAFSEYMIPIKEYEILIREGMAGKDLVKDILRARHYAFHKRTIDHILDIKSRVFKQIVQFQWIAGFTDFYECLRDMGIATALVTGSTRDEVEQIFPIKEIERFNIVITSDDVSSSKPDPEGYQEAVRRLNLSPKKVLVLENAPLGIQAAHEAGLKCCALTSTLDREDLKAADYIVDGYEQLYEELFFSPQTSEVAVS